MPVSVCLCPPFEIDQVWNKLADGFARSCKKSGGVISTGELWQGCRAGHFFLFIAFENETIVAASIWRTERWDGVGVFSCLALFGTNFDLWKDEMRAVIAKVAKDAGATDFVADGRVGWKALFPKARVVRVTLREPIDGG